MRVKVKTTLPDTEGMKFFLLFALVLLSSCAKKKDDVRVANPKNNFESSVNYFSSTRRLTVEVAYESGHAPYTDTKITLSNGSPTSLWSILEENLNALYLGRNPFPIIAVPKSLSEMQELPVQGKTSWTVEDLLALAKEHRKGLSSETQSYFWVVFLGGHFNDGKEDQKSMVGVSLGGTTILAIFKDVVRETGVDQGLVQRYVEQATLVHELGHALGLVNNGLTMHEDHQDSEHGLHCKNPECVMFWLNEGRADLVGFVGKMIKEGHVIMFDQQCLDDARKFSPKD